MPFYQVLKEGDKNDKRTIEYNLLLKNQLRKEIPERTLNKTLLLATLSSGLRAIWRRGCSNVFENNE